MKSHELEDISSSSSSECGGVVGDDDLPTEEEEDVAGGFDGIIEETVLDLALLGDEAKTDKCEADEDEGDDYAWDDERVPDPLSSDDENEEEMRPAEAYREDIDSEELLQLGRTFSDADEFKHTCLRYTIKTRRNIKYVRSSD